jgi:hypothetical protein
MKRTPGFFPTSAKQAIRNEKVAMHRHLMSGTERDLAKMRATQAANTTVQPEFDGGKVPPKRDD